MAGGKCGKCVSKIFFQVQVSVGLKVKSVKNLDELCSVLGRLNKLVGKVQCSVL